MIFLENRFSILDLPKHRRWVSPFRPQDVTFRYPFGELGLVPELGSSVLLRLSWNSWLVRNPNRATQPWWVCHVSDNLGIVFWRFCHFAKILNSKNSRNTAKMRWNRSILAGYLFILLVLFAHLSSCDWPVHSRCLCCKSFIVEIESLHRCIQIYLYIHMYTGWWFEPVFIFPYTYWECHHPNWLIFFSGVGGPHQPIRHGESPICSMISRHCDHLLLKWRAPRINSLVGATFDRSKAICVSFFNYKCWWQLHFYCWLTGDFTPWYIMEPSNGISTHTRIYIYIHNTYLEQDFQLLTMSDFQLPYVL